ncbi:MAG: cobalamin-independent methionine synthase II family protein [Acidobacteria bacterium]|nr:cobalamin-independent methionine synthase II family protein [Acidobacteriota bacterium]
MKRSTDRILTTHVGSLARPDTILEVMRARAAGEAVDEGAFGRRVSDAVTACVRKQVEAGIDVVSDGEQGKDSFYAYARERLAGFEARDRGPQASRPWSQEIRAFSDYYEKYYFGRRSKGRVGADLALVCTGPVRYKGQAQVQTDIANLKAAAAAAAAVEAFMPATAPQGLGSNEYYKTDEEFMLAIAEAMREEYRAIVDAGLVLQVDDPALTSFFSLEGRSPAERRRLAEAYVEALNHALRGIPPEKVRFHTCYGLNEGPRVHDAPLRDIIETMLRVNVGAYSFEAANPRHEHEYHVFEDVKLPAGKAIIPGVISHTTNVVEHPELVAERIVRYARLVGRENVIAGSDCGFSSQATFMPDVHPSVVWAKFQALGEGAKLASQRLWRQAES